MLVSGMKHRLHIERRVRQRVNLAGAAESAVQTADITVLVPAETRIEMSAAVPVFQLFRRL